MEIDHPDLPIANQSAVDALIREAEIIAREHAPKAPEPLWRKIGRIAWDCYIQLGKSYAPITPVESVHLRSNPMLEQ